MIVDTQNNKQYQVVVVTPAGRQRHLDILKRYIYKHMREGLIDGWQLWVNTNSQSDKDYMRSMTEENPLVHICTVNNMVGYDAFRICEFFANAQDENTIYLRFDDDIIWLADDMVKTLLQARLENPVPFAISANIVDNTLCSHIHQQIGAVDASKGIAGYDRLDPVGWQSPEFILHLHDTFIRRFKENTVDAFKFENKSLVNFEPFSISCFAFWGRDHFAPARDEEMWISSERPRELNRPNMFCGKALVVHYGYHTQRAFVDQNPHILEFYRSIAPSL